MKYDIFKNYLIFIRKNLHLYKIYMMFKTYNKFMFDVITNLTIKIFSQNVFYTNAKFGNHSIVDTGKYMQTKKKKQLQIKYGNFFDNNTQIVFSLTILNIK